MQLTTEIRYLPESTNTLLTNVQSVTWSFGRRTLTDPFPAGRVLVTGRRPDLLPAIQINDRMSVSIYSGLYGTGDRFRVADLIVDYGIASSEDTWQLVLEDSIAVLGRSYVTTSFAAGDLTSTAFATVATAAGVNSVTDVGASKVSAQSFTDTNALTICNQILATEQAYLYTVSATTDTVTVSGRNSSPSFTIVFTDGTVAGAGYKFDKLSFGGLADNYATKTVVEPAGLAAQSSGTGKRVVVVPSYDQTTSQAANLAAYVNALLSYTAKTPTEISFLSSTLTDAIPLQELFAKPRSGLTIKFRSSTYYAIVEGGILTADPNDVRVTLFLSGADQTNYLTLDNAVTGKLDNNRLGF